MKERFSNIEKIAETFDTTRHAIYQKIRRGVFPKDTYFKLGRRIYFNEEKLTSWLGRTA